jgi:hypothetical protein
MSYLCYDYVEKENSHAVYMLYIEVQELKLRLRFNLEVI